MRLMADTKPQISGLNFIKLPGARSIGGDGPGVCLAAEVVDPEGGKRLFHLLDGVQQFFESGLSV